MLRKTGAFITVLIISIFISWSFNEVDCYLNRCDKYIDVPLVEALAVITFCFYTFLTLGIIFPSAIFLNKQQSIWVSAAIPSLIASTLLTALFFSPEVDSLFRVLGLFGGLVTQWFISCAVGLFIWPKQAQSNLQENFSQNQTYVETTNC